MGKALGRRIFPRVDHGDSADDALQAAIDGFFWRCEAKNLSQHTIEYYRYRFEAFTRYLREKELHVGPADITPQTIREYLADETARISALTAEHSYVTLKCFFRFLVSDGVLDANPIDKVDRPRLSTAFVPTGAICWVRRRLIFRYPTGSIGQIPSCRS